MLKFTINKGGKVKICGSCVEDHGIKKVQLVEGAEIRTMDEFTDWGVDSDKVLTF